MNHNDDFIGQLEDYLEAFDGMTPLPDRVRDAIRAELPSARQVQPRTGLVRYFTMLSNASAGARVGLAAAAVVVAVVLGAAFLNNSRSPGIGAGAGTPTPSPTPAPTATPTPSAASVVPTLGEATAAPCSPADTSKGCLAAGTYRLTGGDGVWPVPVTLDVPAGWFEWHPGTGWDAVLVDKGRGADASGWGVMFTTVGDVARDPCDSTKGKIPAAQVDTPQRLAAAIAAWPRFTATAPQPITVDGHSGLEFRLTSTAGGSCDTESGSAWQTASGATVDAYPMVNSVGARDAATVEIVDTGRGLLVIRSTDFPQTSPAELSGGIAPDQTRHAGDQAALHAIIDSVRLGEPSPGASPSPG
jgi:hypothetical protein